MDMRGNKVKEYILFDLLKLYYEPTSTLISDICTKNLDSTKHTYHTNRMFAADVTPSRLCRHLEEVCQYISDSEVHKSLYTGPTYAKNIPRFIPYDVSRIIGNLLQLYTLT